MNEVKPYRVLVIEDNPGDFVIVEDFLTEQISHPVIIEHVVNFKEASAVFVSGNSNFDVVLLDLTLPDNSGENLVSEVLRLASPSPVIILTGYTNLSFSIKSISLGVSDYLIKDDLNAVTLYKSILYSIERKKIIFQLEESEKRYSNLFHLSPQPMWVNRLDTFQFLDVNNAAIRNYGYSWGEFMSMKVKDITPAEDRLVIKNDIHNLTNEESSFSHGNCRHQKKNGEIIQVEFQKNTIFFKGKKAEIVVANDITERTKYINTIEDKNKKLREIAWMQSHVVRAPLSRMMGLIDLMKNYSLADMDKGDLLDNLLSSALELDNVIRDISGKIEEGQN